MGILQKTWFWWFKVRRPDEGTADPILIPWAASFRARNLIDDRTLGLHIARSRSCWYTLGPKVGSTDIPKPYGPKSAKSPTLYMVVFGPKSLNMEAP